MYKIQSKKVHSCMMYLDLCDFVYILYVSVYVVVCVTCVCVSHLPNASLPVLSVEVKRIKYLTFFFFAFMN